MSNPNGRTNGVEEGLFGQQQNLLHGCIENTQMSPEKSSKIIKVVSDKAEAADERTQARAFVSFSSRL